MRKNALSVIDVTGGKCMSKTVRFTFDVDFVTDDTSCVDACACELMSIIEEKIYDMFDVFGLPSVRAETDVLDNENDELDIRVEYKEES